MHSTTFDTTRTKKDHDLHVFVPDVVAEKTFKSKILIL